MAPVIFPSALPCPRSAPLAATERRLWSALPGARESRAVQRDRLATQAVEFIFTFDELEVFTAWLDGPLVQGGAWFSASWPLPQGGEGVRRFVDAPSYPEFLINVGWRVSASCEVRGRGLAPVT